MFEHDGNNVQFVGNVKTRLCGLTGLRKRGVKNAKRVVMFALLPKAKRRKHRKHSERGPPKGKTVATTQGSHSPQIGIGRSMRQNENEAETVDNKGNSVFLARESVRNGTTARSMILYFWWHSTEYKAGHNRGQNHTS